MFIYQALGIKYAAIFVLLVLALVAASSAMWMKPRRNVARWLYLFLAVIPMVVGIYATLEGLIVNRFFSPTPVDLEHGQSLAVVSLWVGLAITTPFFITALFLLRRHGNCQPPKSTGDSNTQIVDPGDFPATTAPGSLFLPGLALSLPIATVVLQLFVLPPGTPAQRIAAWGMIGLSSLVVVLDHRHLQKLKGTRVKISWFIQWIGLIGVWVILFPLMFLFRRRFGRPNLFPFATVSVLLYVLLPMALLAFGPLPPGSLTPGYSGTPFASDHRFEIRLASETQVEGWLQREYGNPPQPVFMSTEPLIDNDGVRKVVPELIDDRGNDCILLEFENAPAERMNSAIAKRPSCKLAFLANDQIVLLTGIDGPLGKQSILRFPDQAECRQIFQAITGREILGSETNSR